MKSKLYKLILDNEVVAEGSRAEMRKKLAAYNKEPLVKERRPFIGIGSPESTLHQKWNSSYDPRPYTGVNAFGNPCPKGAFADISKPDSQK